MRIITKKRVILSLMIVMILVSTLTGCGGNSAKKYVGTWNAVMLVSGDDRKDVSDSGTSFTLKEDGTGTITLDTGTTDISWEVTEEGLTIDLKKITFDMMNLGMNLSLLELTEENGKLVLDTEKQSTYHKQKMQGAGGMNFTFAMELYFEKQKQ